jgi:hypothetical protein
MSGPAHWLLNRRALRIVLIAAAFPLPLVNLLSSAMVALAGVARGGRIALEDAALAALLLALLLAVSGAQWLAPALTAWLVWSAVAAAGGVAGRYGSMTLAVQLLLALVLAALLVMRLAWGDAGELWRPFLEEVLSQLAAAGTTLDEVPVAALASLMSGFVAAGVLAGLVLSLLLGCWLAAAAGGPPAGAMFRELSLGRVLAGTGALAGIGAALGLGLAAHWLLVLAAGFVFQGLAVIHWTARERSWPSLWALGLYGPLLLVAPLAALILGALASVGFMDNWLPLRRRSGDEA